ASCLALTLVISSSSCLSSLKITSYTLNCTPSRRDLGALRRRQNGSPRRRRVARLARQEDVQRLFDRTESDFACKERGKVLCAQNRLDGGELLGRVAHPDAIATFDGVLARTQQHGVGNTRLRGRMLLELLLDYVQPVVELLRL